MSTNELLNESGVGVDPNANEVDYIEAIKQMRENTVSKDAYAKIVEENKRLVQSLVNGESLEVEKEDPVNIDELRNKLFNADADLTNLEYVDTALKLRNELIARGERDPFLPIGEHVNITADIIAQAQNVADVLQECVDFADGDSGIFTAQLQRKLTDPSIYSRGR